MWASMFLNFMDGLKVPYWQFFNSGKMALLKPCMKFKFVFPERLLLKHYEQNIPKMSQGPPNPGFS